MDINRYEAFVAAAESGSMSTAAKQLGYTPSGIIRLVNALEEDLGFPLLARRSTGVSLTVEGERVLPYYRQIIQLNAQAQATSARIRGLAEGRIAIGALDSIAAVWLPRVLKDFQKRFPGVRLDIVTGSDERLRHMLDHHEIDCCIFHGNHAKLTWIPLGRQELVVWLPKSSHLNRFSTVILAELDGQPFVRIHPEASTFAEQLLLQRNIEPDVRFSAGDSHTAYRMVEAGLGYALCCNGLTQGWRGDVEERPLSPEQYVEFGLALPETPHRAPAVEEFILVAQRHANTWPSVLHR